MLQQRKLAPWAEQDKNKARRLHWGTELPGTGRWVVQAGALPSMGWGGGGRMAGCLTSSWLVAAACHKRPMRGQGPNELQLAGPMQPALPCSAAVPTGEKRNATNLLCLSLEGRHPGCQERLLWEWARSHYAPIIFASEARDSSPHPRYDTDTGVSSSSRFAQLGNFVNVLSPFNQYKRNSKIALKFCFHKPKKKNVRSLGRQGSCCKQVLLLLLGPGTQSPRLGFLSKWRP